MTCFSKNILLPGLEDPFEVVVLCANRTRMKQRYVYSIVLGSPEELNESAEREGKARNAVIVHLIRFGLDAYYQSRNVKRQPCHQSHCLAHRRLRLFALHWVRPELP